mmetsp:Transcript_2305/g.4045  ORF Transcript_2305/g.4045 Transcript_2305/m.4045 type:complete len:167 (+) Transcript_2305:90-590(+)
MASKWLSSARSRIDTLVDEAKWRGLWGTVRALKLNKFGSKPYLVGEDELGNRYFENKHLTHGRHRWVEYFEQRHISFDPVKIPPEWHAWISHIVDEPPLSNASKPRYQGAITSNRTGTHEMYISQYSPLAKSFSGRAKERVTKWDPSKKRSAEIAPLEGKDIYDLK